MKVERGPQGTPRPQGPRDPAGGPAPRGANRARGIALALLPPLAAILVFSVTVGGGFVFDDTVIAGDEELQSFDLERIFWDRYWGKLRFDVNYRPLILLSYALNWQVSSSPAGFHAVNVVLNAAVAWIVFLLLRELLRDDVIASLGATLYAVLPIHTEAVAWVVGRAELVAALAVLGTWLIVLRSPERKLAPALWALPIVFLGLSAKESTAVAVPVLLASAWVLRGRHHLLAKRSVLAAGAGLVAIGLYWMLRSWALAEEFRLLEEEDGATLLGRVDNPLHWDFTDHATRTLNALRLQGLYLWKTVVPLRLSADYSYDQISVLSPGNPRLWVEIAAFVVPLAGAGWYFWKRGSVVALLGVIFFPAAFLVTSNIVFPIGTIFAERLAYLPSLAYPLVLCGLLRQSVEKDGTKRRAALVAVGLIIALYAARSVRQSLLWTDTPTLYAATVEASPRSARARLLAATGAIRRADEVEDRAGKRALYAAALEHARRAREIAPFHGRAWGRTAQAYFFRAKAFGDIEDFRRAEEYYTRAIELGSSEPNYYFQRGESRLQLGKFAVAGEDFDHCLRMERLRRTVDEAKAYNFRGLCRGVLADRLEKAARTEPPARAKAAEAQARRLRELARKDFDRAIRIYPAEPGFYANRGYLRFRSGDPEGAIEDYRKGLELCREAGTHYSPEGDSVWLFRRRIADVLESTGDREGAARERRRAAELRRGG